MKHRHGDISFAAFSKEISLSFYCPILPKLLCEIIKLFLLHLCGELKKNGCQLIGHIKLLLKNDKGEFYFFSVTSFDMLPECKGDILEAVSKITLTINVIVYGLPESQINMLVNKKLKILTDSMNTKGG